MTQEVWLVKGLATDGVTTEYQFSDAPPGKRSMSSDYADLEQGLADHSGYIIHWWREDDGR